MLNIDEFRDYLKIDRLSLDDEFGGQPQLLYKVSEALTEAIDQRDRLEESLKVVDAELDSEIRRGLENSEQKSTEGMIKSRIQTHKRHKAAFTAYADAKLLTGRLFALKESFQKRGDALEYLARLFVANYYEASSSRGTDASDTAAYRLRRQRMATARESR